MSGTQDGLIERYIRSNRFGELLGMDFTILSPGIVEYRMTIEEKHLATPKAAHGGAVSALADGALGVAGLSAVHTENKVVSTIEYKINFLSPAFAGDRLLARARVLQKGRRLIVVSCDISCPDRDNIGIATAIGTFNAYDAAKAGY